MILFTKFESYRPCSFIQEYFRKLHFQNLFFDPMTYLYIQSELFCIIFVGDNEWIIYVEFVQNFISDVREKIVQSFSHIIKCKIVSPGEGLF